MQQGNGCGTSKGGGRGSESGGCDKAQDMTNVIKGECATEPPLDQPGRQNRFAGIAEPLSTEVQRLRSPTRLAMMVATTTPMTTAPCARGPAMTRMPTAMPEA